MHNPEARLLLSRFRSIGAIACEACPASRHSSYELLVPGGGAFLEPAAAAQPFTQDGIGTLSSFINASAQRILRYFWAVIFWKKTRKYRTNEYIIRTPVAFTRFYFAISPHGFPCSGILVSQHRDASVGAVSSSIISLDKLKSIQHTLFLPHCYYLYKTTWCYAVP